MNLFVLLGISCTPPSDKSRDTKQGSSASEPESQTEPAEENPGTCAHGDVVETSTPCGDGGVQIDVCQDGDWVRNTYCLLQPNDEELEYDRINVFSAYQPVDWEYGNEFESHIHGWSYYIRAFDLIQDQPVQEVGWGQWSKPNIPDDGLEVCGVHPHGFTCEGMDSTDPDLAGCGYTDPSLMESCDYWCCSEEDKCGVRGSIEGGMGYWMYSLETNHVKWMMPGSTNMNYEIFGGTFLHDRAQPCSSLGGAVRISNRLLLPNDFLHFSGDEIDGFVGYMLSKTPIGKRSEEDAANYWTIIVDTENFSGPVMYMSAWFWDARINWSPKSVSWSDPRALIGYIAQGFEGAMGTMTLIDKEGNRWLRTNRWALPKDKGTDLQSTLFTAHSQYKEDWAIDGIEPILSGASFSASSVKHTAMSKRSTPNCVSPDISEGFRLGLEDEQSEYEWRGLGVGTMNSAQAESAENLQNGCSAVLTLDDNILDCDSNTDWCEGYRFLKLDPTGNTSSFSDQDVPVEIKNTFELRSFQPTRSNDGRYLGPPAQTEEACFSMPGPADETTYCTRTESGVWLAYQWYRFVDQPELNQVFASLPQDERDAAKCYMQARIERLHQVQQSGSEVPRWFEPPQGTSDLPEDLASLDPNLLVAPPSGMEVGFVPIPIMERKREKPSICDVVVGAIQEEPEPFPQGYYDQHVWINDEYDVQVCESNPESEAEFNHPGLIFGYPTGSDPTSRTGYTVPLREDIAGVLSATSPTCGLPSDPN